MSAQPTPHEVEVFERQRAVENDVALAHMNGFDGVRMLQMVLDGVAERDVAPATGQSIFSARRAIPLSPEPGAVLKLTKDIAVPARQNFTLTFHPFRPIGNTMNPEEAREKLLAFFEDQSNTYNKVPRVRYTMTTTTHTRPVARQFVRIFAIDGTGEAVSLDYWLARANETPVRRHPRSGEYSPETGFRVDGLQQGPHATVYDLLCALGDTANDGPFAKLLDIREVL